MADEDSMDEPAQPAGATESGLEWYEPADGDPKPPPAPPPPAAPPPPPEPRPLLLAAIADVYSFEGGTIDGTATELRLRFGGVGAGLTAGAVLSDTPGFVGSLGGDFFRYYGVRIVGSEDDNMQLRLLFPTLEVRLVTDFNEFVAMPIGSALTGVRLTSCPFAVELRGPVFTFWPVITDGFDSTARTWGVQLAFGWELADGRQP